MIYLDNAATTFPKPEEVYKRMDFVNRNLAVNDGRGSYRLAKEATDIIVNTKNQLLKLVNGKGASVSFQPSITIALNQTLLGLDWSAIKNVYVTPYEHNAVARTLNLMKNKHNCNIIEIPINKKTFEIDIDAMQYEFSKINPDLVCVNAMSNVIGYILPFKKIFEIAKKYKSITILDTAQALGLVKIDLFEDDIDVLAFAGHKSLYGPFGVGGLITTNKIRLNPEMAGGTGSDSLNLDMPKQFPENFEFASKNIIAISGLEAALENIDYEKNYNFEKKLSEYLINKLLDIENTSIYLPKNLSNHNSIVSFNIDEMIAADVGYILDKDFNIAVRTGYHCAPYIHKHLKDFKNLGTVRVGIGMYTSIEDIDTLISAIDQIANE